MQNLTLCSALAGLLFGIWPLMMNKSGLPGNVSTSIFALTAFLCVMPFSIRAWGSVHGANWGYAIAAGVLGGIGLLLLNGMLSKATTANIGTFFVVMIIVQTATPVLYQAYLNGMTVKQGVSFALAIVSVALLVF
ncbi:MAG: hypothetical protein WCX27_03015 [Candidatus Paceibacterota bacterium]|jgi:hypothetical protein